MDIVDLLVQIGAAKSRSEAKRLLKQGAVKIDGQKVGINTKVEVEKPKGVCS